MVRTDAELVNAVLDGDKELFAELVRRYERPVRAIALDVCSDYHWATDISQQAFLKAYEKLASLRNPQAFGPWLITITRRYAIDWARQNANKIRSELKVGSTIDKPNNQLDKENQELLAAIARLPEALQQVIMLHYLNRNSVKDVANILNRSVGTVTKQLSRARISLKEILERSPK